MLKSKVLKGISWMLAGRLVGHSLGLISTLIIARLLTPDHFGVFALAASTIHIVSAMFEIRASFILIQLSKPKKTDFDTVFTLNLLRGLLVAIVIWAGARPVAQVFAEPRLGDLLTLLAFYPILLSLQNPYFEVHARKVSFAPATLQEISIKVATFLGSVGVAIIYPTYWALACGLLASAVASVTVSYLMADRLPNLSLESIRRVFSFSIWLTFSSILNQINQSSDRFVIGAALTTTLVGGMALATQIVNQLVNALLQPVNWATYSAFSTMKDENGRLIEAYKSTQATTCAVLLPICVGLLLVAEPMVLAVFGENWHVAILFVQYSAMRFAITIYAGPFWALAMSKARTKDMFYRSAWSTAIRLSFTLSGFALFGLVGLLNGGILAACVSLLISLFFVKRLVSVKVVHLLSAPLRPLLATLAMTASLLAFQMLAEPISPLWARLVVQIVLGVIVYLGTSLALWKVAGSPEGPEALGVRMGRRALAVVRLSFGN